MKQFIKDMDKHWKAMWPTISTGGHCIAMSTTNGSKNWFYDIYRAAEKEQNAFRIFRSNYWEHPQYKDPEWVKRTREQLGEKVWMQEILGDFLVEVEQVKEKIIEWKDVEQEKFENLSEGLQQTERGQNLEKNVEDLESIESNFEDAINSLTEIFER